VDEEPVDVGMAVVEHRLPPLVERDPDDLAAEPLDRRGFRQRSTFRHDDPAANAEPPRAPGDALSHIAGARRVDAVRQGLPACDRHRVGRAADLERPDRLEVLELEQDPRAAVLDAEANERRSHGDALDSSPGGLDLGERNRRERLGARSNSRPAPLSRSGRATRGYPFGASAS